MTARAVARWVLTRAAVYAGAAAASAVLFLIGTGIYAAFAQGGGCPRTPETAALALHRAGAKRIVALDPSGVEKAAAIWFDEPPHVAVLPLFQAGMVADMPDGSGMMVLFAPEGSACTGIPKDAWTRARRWLVGTDA